MQAVFFVQTARNVHCDMLDSAAKAIYEELVCGLPLPVHFVCGASWVCISVRGDDSSNAIPIKNVPSFKLATMIMKIKEKQILFMLCDTVYDIHYGGPLRAMCAVCNKNTSFAGSCVFCDNVRARMLAVRRVVETLFVVWLQRSELNTDITRRIACLLIAQSDPNHP